MATRKTITGIGTPLAIQWLSSTKVVAVTGYGDPGGHGDPAGYFLSLYVSNDAGTTWGFVSGSNVSWVNDQISRVITDITSDASSNIYFVMADNSNTVIPIIKWTKGTGDSWTGSAGLGLTLPSASRTPIAFEGPKLIVLGTNIHLAVNTVGPNGPQHWHAYAPIATMSQFSPDPYTYTSIDLGATSAPSMGGTMEIRNTVLTYFFWDYTNRRIGYKTWNGSSWSSASYSSTNLLTTDDIQYTDTVNIAPYGVSKVIISWVNRRTYNSTAYPAKQGVYYTVFDGTTFSAVATVEESTGLTTNKVYYYGPYLSYDINSIIISYLKRAASAADWTVKSRRYNADTLESATSGETFTADLSGADYLGSTYTASVGGIGPNSASIKNLPFIYYFKSLSTPAQSEELQLWDNNYAPLQPTIVAPSGGIATFDTTPNLSWLHNAGSVGDTQSAYQVIVYKQSDGSTIWDSGKVTSTSQNVDVPNINALTNGITYQWKVRTYSQADIASVYTSLALFKVSARPVVVITSPTDGGVASSDTPLIQWTYTDSEGTPQSKYKVEILDSTGLNVIYTTPFITGTDISYQIPNGYLINGTSYKVRVTLIDGDNITSVPVTHSFDVDFVTPPSPTVTGSVDSNKNAHLAIGLTVPDDDAWPVDYLKIYRKKSSDIDYTLLESAFQINTLSIADGESTTDWSASGIGTSPITSTAKVGLNAIGMGASGAGTASYVKTVAFGSWISYDQIQLWLYAVDKTKFSSIRIKFGQDSSNYYYYDQSASGMANGVWEMAEANFSSLSQTGSPNKNSLTYFAVDILSVTGAVTAGNIRIDQIRFIQTAYEYIDYATANNSSYIYGVSSYNIGESLESIKANSSPLDIIFDEQYINTYLVPVDNPTALIKSFIDGSRVPAWTDKTETKYYTTKGSSKPAVLIEGRQKYKEGSLELRFFDAIFGGQGLEGIDALETIKNYKPLIFKAWWGRNYYISIDGDVSTVRKPGIGWFATFNFTEIG